VSRLQIILGSPKNYLLMGDALYLELMAAHKPEHRAKQMIQFIESL
jgi:hypothetical protein